MEAEPHGRTVPRWYSTGVVAESNPNPSPEEIKKKKKKKVFFFLPIGLFDREEGGAPTCWAGPITGWAEPGPVLVQAGSGPTLLGRPDPNRN
ncbi:hypothetical protein Scep_007192 [Stephania cephalantha]|uniref:Uncharacterized protein n=1 Tax=Stephania cephalantha TaxID=152367 RepID=A0AAP0PNL2_9MAGN